MKYLPSGSAVDRVRERIVSSAIPDSKNPGPGPLVSVLTPLDPLRQAKRLPIRVIKMLTAHTGHLLHPEYLQPLTSSPVSIEVCTDFDSLFCFFFFNPFLSLLRIVLDSRVICSVLSVQKRTKNVRLCRFEEFALMKDREYVKDNYRDKKNISDLHFLTRILF